MDLPSLDVNALAAIEAQREHLTSAARRAQLKTMTAELLKSPDEVFVTALVHMAATVGQNPDLNHESREALELILTNAAKRLARHIKEP